MSEIYYIQNALVRFLFSSVNEIGIAQLCTFRINGHLLAQMIQWPLKCTVIHSVQV